MEAEVKAWLRLALVCAPAVAGALSSRPDFSWYILSAGLVVVLLGEIQRGRPMGERVACWVGMVIYSAAAVYGMASESGAVDQTGLWVLLGCMAFGAEAIHQWGMQWPRR